MHKTSAMLIKKCQLFRKRGFTLGEIVKILKIPKTTIYGHVYNVALSPQAQKRLKETQEKIAEENTRRVNEFNIKHRKGKCVPGRVVLKPKNWSNELVSIVAHFMFDGEIQSRSCIYSNRNKVLIERVKKQMKIIFNLTPYELFNKETGVHRISYHYVELADYIRKKTKELINYIGKTSLIKKRTFLLTFFDDEGCVHIWRNNRRIRGYQHNLEILKLVQKLLKDFNIASKIDEKYQEIVINKKENLLKFRDKINFSKGVNVNGRRKNSIWKQDLEKQKILEIIIASYKPIGTPGVHY